MTCFLSYMDDVTWASEVELDEVKFSCQHGLDLAVSDGTRVSGESDKTPRRFKQLHNQIFHATRHPSTSSMQ